MQFKFALFEMVTIFLFLNFTLILRSY